MNRHGAFALSMILLALSACAQGEGAQNEAPEEAPRNVRVLELQPQPLEEYLTLSGPLRPISATDISAEESGTIESIRQDKGAQVRKGDVLVMLDRDLLAAELASAEADRLLKEYNEERTRSLFEGLREQAGDASHPHPTGASQGPRADGALALRASCDQGPLHGYRLRSLCGARGTRGAGTSPSCAWWIPSLSSSKEEPPSGKYRI